MCTSVCAHIYMASRGVRGYACQGIFFILGDLRLILVHF